MPLYGLPGGVSQDALNQLMGQARGAGIATGNAGQQQDISEWTQLASLLGYNPDPFPKQGSTGQDEIRFLNTMKSIMDQQLGAFGKDAQINQLPGSMQQLFQMFAPLMTSPGAVRTVAPTGTAGMMANGYKMGPLPTAMSPLIQMLASAMKPSGSDAITPGPTNPALTSGATSVSSSNINQTPTPPGDTPAPVYGQDISSQAAAAGRTISPANSFTGSVPGGGPTPSTGIVGPGIPPNFGIPPSSVSAPPGLSPNMAVGSDVPDQYVHPPNPASVEGIGQELSTVFNLLMQPGALQKILGSLNPFLGAQNAANTIPNNWSPGQR